MEVVHYAITAMVELSKEYDYRLQKIEKKYTNDPDDPVVLEEYCDFLKEYLGSNLNVRVWTVNEKADMKWLIDAGVTAIITNYPDMAVQIKKGAEV